MKYRCPKSKTCKNTSCVHLGIHLREPYCGRSNSFGCPKCRPISPSKRKMNVETVKKIGHTLKAMWK